MTDDSNVYDCIIIGAGPAGLAGALYTSRDRLSTLILEKFYPGGQINNTDRIENYPGIERIDGPGLIEAMHNQVRNFGTEVQTSSEVTGLSKSENGRLQVSCDDKVYRGKVIIAAPGSDYRKLGIPGEDKFRKAGTGVSYCGTCDAPFFKGKKVLAVGGGNTAVEETLHLTRYAEHVTLIHRRDELRATRVLAEQLAAKAKESGTNLSLRYSTIATSIKGSDKVESVRLKDVKTGREEDFVCDGVFIFVGMVPNTDFLKGFVELTDKGFIKCDCAYLRTSVPGVFAAGDCRVGAAMQLATAVADGVVAAVMLKQYMLDSQWWQKPATDILQPGGW